MKTSWFKLVSAAIVMGALVGCGQRTSTAPSDAAKPTDATKEMQAREAQEMGDVNLDAPKAKKKEEAAPESGGAAEEE
jgi:hypothetical protein